jgi:hypothetical protein
MVAARIAEDIKLLWNAEKTYFFMDGDSEALALSLTKNEGSSFKSNDMYLFARIDVDIKLVEGDSAGTVATIYVRSMISSPHHVDRCASLFVCLCGSDF